METISSGGGGTEGAVDDGGRFWQILGSGIWRNNVANLAVLYRKGSDEALTPCERTTHGTEDLVELFLMNFWTVEFDFDGRIGESVEIFDPDSRRLYEKDVGFSPAEPGAMVSCDDGVLRFAKNNVENLLLLLRFELSVAGASSVVEWLGEGVCRGDERSSIFRLRNRFRYFDGEGGIFWHEGMEMVEGGLLLEAGDEMTRIEQSNFNWVNVVEVEVSGPLLGRSGGVSSPTL